MKNRFQPGVLVMSDCEDKAASMSSFDSFKVVNICSNCASSQFFAASEKYMPFQVVWSSLTLCEFLTADDSASGVGAEVASVVHKETKKRARLECMMDVMWRCKC
jgi:hypothetical protein